MQEFQIHKSFKLQGKSFNTNDEVIEFSKSISFEIFDFFKEWFNTNSFLEVKTSGSTGKPKTIQLKKEYMINSAKATGNFFNLPENTTALLCMSSNYIAGKMMLVRALVLGWELGVVAPSSNPLAEINKVYDFSAMVPMQLHHSLKELHKVKKLIIGGGAVSTELLKKIQNVETQIFATYGMTETITHIAVKKLNHFKNGEEANYRVLPNIKISTDSRGCLVIDAPLISEEKVSTNDLVEVISEKEFNWLGRFDNIINSGGVKLIPEQIEAKLSEIIEYRFFITGIPDDILGEKLVLVVEIGEEIEKKKQEIFNKIEQLPSLTKFEKPKVIYTITSFIETSTKKINRKETLKLL